MTLPMYAMVDLTPVGAKIDDIIRLTGVLIEISIDEKNRRDFRSGVSKMEAGIDNLRRLPGTTYAVTALSRELSKVRHIQDPAAGAKAIRKLLQKLASAYKLAEQARKDEQKRAREKAAERRKAMVDEIAYQSTREEVQAKLVIFDNEPLGRMVGDLGERIDQARRDRDAADQLLADGESKAALKAIQKVLQDCTGVIKEWNKRVAKMKGKHQQLLQTANTYYKEFSATTILSTEESKELTGTLDQLLVPLLDDKVSKELVTAIGKDLERLYTDGKKIISGRQEQQDETRQLIEPQVKKIRDLLVIALGRELTEELRLSREAEKLLEQREYTKAQERAQTLKEGYAALEQRLTTAYGDWTRTAKGPLKELHQAITEQRQTAEEAGFAFRHEPEALMSACLRLEEGLMTTRSYTEANQDFRDLQARVQENAQLLQSWEGIDGHRTDEQEKVKVQLALTREALATLSQAMVEAMSQREDAPEDWAPHDIGGLSARLATCLSGWETLCKTATTTEQLQAAPTVIELIAIADEAARVAAPEGGVGQMVDADLRNAALARYATVRGRLVEKIPAWNIFPIPHAEQIQTALEDAQTAISGASSAPAAEINEIALGLEQKLSLGLGEAALVDGLLESARQGLVDRVREARRSIAQAQKAAEQRSLLMASEVRKLREKCLLETQKLAEQVDTIAGRHASDVLDVFHEGTKALVVIQARCAKLAEICRNGKEGEDDIVLPETFARLVKACRIRLGDKDLKKRRPSELYTLTKKLDGIEERLDDSEHTSRIEASLQEWDLAYDEAMALVKRDLREQEAFDELHRVVSGMLAQLKDDGVLEGYAGFAKKLEGSLKSAQQQAAEEDGLRSADTTLRIAKADIERLVMARTEEGRERGLDLSRELRQGEAAAASGKERQKDQEKAWKARVDVFEKRWLPKVSGRTGADDVSGLVKIAKNAAKQEPPDYDAANRYLQMAADRAQLVIQFPDGPVTMSLSRLPGEAQRWSQAVVAFRSSLDPLDQHFQTLEDPSRKALRAGLAELRLQFDPNAFTPIVQRICAKSSDGDTRARAREEALAHVRQYRDVLIRDARFRLLHKHPFPKAGAWKGHLLLQRPLIELERLLLMAVPTA